MTDEPLMKMVNGKSMPLTEADIAERKAMQEAWERDEPIRIKMAQSAADAALADPDLMRLWGEIHSIWDEIEQALMMGFYSLSDDDLWLSRTIFFSQKMHASRRQMVLEIAKHRFWSNDDVLKPISTVLKRVAARADARNNLFHGQWGWRNEGTIETVQPVRMVVEANLSFKSKMYGIDDLKQVREDMRSTLQDLREVFKPLIEIKMEYDRTNFFNRRRL